MAIKFISSDGIADGRGVEVRKRSAVQPASGGGKDAPQQARTRQANVARNRSGLAGGAAGIKPGPSEAKPKRGRPRIEDRDKTIEAQKPWEALGMSRRTWYARQAEARKKGEMK